MPFDAYIYDHVRTPRGKGKKDGSLHQASPVWLLRTLLQALQQRLGSTPRWSTTWCWAASRRWASRAPTSRAPRCSTPNGRRRWPASRRAASAPRAGVGQPGRRQGGQRLRGPGRGRRRGEHEPLAMGSDGGAWVMDPRINQKLGFVPQGVGADLIATLEGWGRADVDAFALRSHQRAAAARARALRRSSWCRCTTSPACCCWTEDETIRPTPPRWRPGQARTQLRDDGADGLRRHRAAQVHRRWSASSTCTTRATRRASSTARR
jgi:acetyl-CoA C-acetyltransferase